MESFLQTMAARIIMIVDLLEYDISYDTNIDAGITTSYIIVAPIRHLTKEMWVVLLVAEAPKEYTIKLTCYHSFTLTSLYISIYMTTTIFE